jgi:hypothetical protein
LQHCHRQAVHSAHFLMVDSRPKPSYTSAKLHRVPRIMLTNEIIVR